MGVATTEIFVKIPSGRGFDLGIGGTSLGRKREPIPLLFIMNLKLALLKALLNNDFMKNKRM